MDVTTSLILKWFIINYSFCNLLQNLHLFYLIYLGDIKPHIAADKSLLSFARLIKIAILINDLNVNFINKTPEEQCTKVMSNKKQHSIKTQ